jgi:DNA invertase Pin-like site-specific DNA recombinase
MQGDSFRRQLALAEAYALKRGWELDRALTLQDVGVSAFRGRNAVEGNLGKFLEHVRTGEVAKGSVLLVESLDRLSRQEVARAQLAFLNLLDSGVTVVTLLDDQEYSWASVNAGDGMVRLIISLTIMSRAHEESATKARRLKEAWAAKRSRLGSEALTSKVPAWLRLNPETRKPELIPERAAIVERIFRDTLGGKGQHSIAAELNREGVKPWGRGAYWHRSYVAKILCNEAVIGTLVPHTVDYVGGKRTRTAQDAVRGYYPAAVPEDLWLDVQALSEGKRSRPKGRHAERPVSHMLARLATCPLCGGSMSRVDKGKRSRPALVCARAKSRAGCAYKAVRVELIEEAILERLPERLRDAPAGERDPELDRRIVNAVEERDRLSEELANVESAIRTGGDVPRLLRMLQELEGQWEEARDTLRGLEARRTQIAGQTVQARIARLIGTLRGAEGDPLDLAAINGALLLCFKRVTVDYAGGVLEFDWQHGGSVEVPYSLPEGLSGTR